MIIAGVDIGECQAAALVGSRVTCDPPPTDTDQDILVLVDAFAFNAKRRELSAAGWELGGSQVNIGDMEDPAEMGSFVSYRLGELNLILTSDGVYYEKFLAATSVAKRLNLLNKEDRIAVFEAVLYGIATTLRDRDELPPPIVDARPVLGFDQQFAMSA